MLAFGLLAFALPFLVQASPNPTLMQQPLPNCGPKAANAGCEKSPFGPCCSTNGFCGRGVQYCGIGNCVGGACSGPLEGVTRDGTCGPNHNNTICGDTVFGPCCSTYGVCGRGEQHCGLGACVSGPCEKESAESNTPSFDGTCGPNFPKNRTCTGGAVAKFGSCCSNFGYCGNSTDFCSHANCFSGKCAAA